MSKKHFIEVAAIIESSINEHGLNPAVADIAHELASFFKRQNSNFDRARFLDACGVES